MNKLAHKTRRRRATAARPTLRTLNQQVARLSARVEDLEDLRDLNEAITRNGEKPGVPWARVKADLGL